MSSTRSDRSAAEAAPSVDFLLLADPSQEVLIEVRPQFSQLAPVPLSQLGAETSVAGEFQLPATDHLLP